MAQSVVSSVGQTIGKLLVEEAKFLWDVEGKVEDLQRELKLIQRFLRDADAKHEHDQVVGEWVAQLRDIAYDAEDVIEGYALRAALKEGQNIIKACTCFLPKCSCVQVHLVGTEIEGLKSRISNLRTSMEGHGIQSVYEGERERARASMPKRTYAHFEEDIVGREDSIKVLVKELKDGKQHRVVSVWGMGGLGKTTLAKKVFAHDQVRNHFSGFAWVCVSQEYQARDILEGILIKLIPDQRERVLEMRDDELFESLYTTQKQKRCIVVLDDIWTKQAWDDLRHAFPIKDMGSKLLVTTRNREVAEYIDPHCFLHELQCLSDEESWELLMRRVSPETKTLTVGLSSVGPGLGQGIATGQGVPTQSEMERQTPVIDENMKSLGDKLLKKCGGLPLAVIVLGGLLAVNEWETVYKRISLYFGAESDVSKVLALSYEDLPWHLKPCLLYLGSFPEDEQIPATKVLHMWIAEGFVSLNANGEHNEIQVQEVAKQYLTELVKRGMVQVRVNVSGKIKTCHLHDLIRDLCVSKAAQECFLSIISIQSDRETEDCSSSMTRKVESTCKTRRLSLNMCKSKEKDMIQHLKSKGRTMLHLRTLMFFGLVKGEYEQFHPIFITCKFLRVLKLEDLEVRGELTESVGNLFHLRFLSLARSRFWVLPQSMGKLVRMEFLDLRNRGSNRVTVPNVLWKMRRLRHLHLPTEFIVKKNFYGDRKKLRLDTLKNLQRLGNFDTNNCEMNDFGKLINLRKLTIRIYYFNKSETISQFAKLDLKHLQFSSFKLRADFKESFKEGDLSKMSSYQHPCKLFLGGEIEKLPEHNNLPQQLRKLVLVWSKMEEDPMPILEKLQHLVVLMLGYEAFEGKEMVCSQGGFPQLKHLVLHYLGNLEEWRVGERAMPHLSRLGISNCPRLKSVPEGVPTYDGYEDIYAEINKFSWG